MWRLHDRQNHWKKGELGQHKQIQIPSPNRMQKTQDNIFIYVVMVCWWLANYRSFASFSLSPNLLSSSELTTSSTPLMTSTSLAASGGTPGALTEDFRCDPCNKNLSSLTRLKRHIQNVHMRPTKEPVCNICKRVYSSLNSLRNHKSIYHRNMKQPKVETKDDANTTPIRTPNYPFFPINPRTA